MSAPINTRRPAYPQDLVDGYSLESMGLTKREVAAIAAMQAILTGLWAHPDSSIMEADKLAREAVEYADALIAELEAPKPHTLVVGPIMTGDEFLWHYENTKLKPRRIRVVAVTDTAVNWHYVDAPDLPGLRLWSEHTFRAHLCRVTP